MNVKDSCHFCSVGVFDGSYKVICGLLPLVLVLVMYRSGYSVNQVPLPLVLGFVTL